jgi:flagellar basal-body rod protein FlgB
MQKIIDSLSLHASSLALRSRRNNILASNIANAATPHFKARDFNFEEALNKTQGKGTLAVTHSTHIISGNSITAELGYRQSLNPSYDGNTVELAVEQMEFSENVIRYQTSLEFLNRRISGLKSAIRGE